MNNTKVIELLYSLESSELKHFTQFAKSEPHLSKEDLTTLNQLIKLVLKSDASKGEEVEEIIFKKYSEKHPDVINIKQKWNKLKSRFTVAINRFILLNLSDNYFNDTLLLDYYRRKKLDRNFRSKYNELEKKIEKGLMDFDNQFFKHKLMEMALLNAEGLRNIQPELEKMELALDSFYVDNKFRVYIEKLNRHRIIGSEKPKYFGDLFENITVIKNKTKISSVYYQLHLMIDHPNDKTYYFKAKTLFYEYFNLLSIDVNREICNYLLNQCTFYYKKNDIGFDIEYLELIQFLMNNKLHSDVNGLSISKYSNAVTVALVAKKFKWAEEFVERYSYFVLHQEIESIKNLNLAHINLLQGKATKAWEYLIEYNFRDTFFKIVSDKIYIKIYFKTEETQSLKSLLRTFKQFIINNSNIKNEHERKNLNFVDAVRKLNKNDFNIIDIDRKDYLSLDYYWLKNISMKP